MPAYHPLFFDPVPQTEQCGDSLNPMLPRQVEIGIIGDRQIGREGGIVLRDDGEIQTRSQLGQNWRDERARRAFAFDERDELPTR